MLEVFKLGIKKNKAVFIIIAIIFLCIATFLCTGILMKDKYQPKITEKSVIISEFNKNYELFSAIQKYVYEKNVELVAYKRDNKVVISINGQPTNNDSIPIKAQIGKILNELNYDSITVETGPILKDIIKFEISYEGFEQGIVFVKDNHSGYGAQMVKICNEWYYYSIGYV